MVHPDEVPVTEGCVSLGVTRDQLVRLIQKRVVDGRFRDGRWWANTASLSTLAKSREAR